MTSSRFRGQRAKGLTKREREVAEYTAQGKSNKYIADQLRISSSTVKKHVSQAMKKLSASNRTELALLLMSDRSDPDTRSLSVDAPLMGNSVAFYLEAAEEAFGAAQYLLQRGVRRVPHATMKRLMNAEVTARQNCQK
jgi:DNA-binding CsgD family transcriptional regulator